jgi:mono/diheme cytochrome c family protein
MTYPSKQSFFMRHKGFFLHHGTMGGRNPVRNLVYKHIVPAIVLLALMVSSCDRTRMDKGYEYFPDMAHSPAYNTYSDNPAMDDGNTMREPVAGTIPRDMVPYPYEAGFEGREQAAMHLDNPLNINSDLLAEGQELYRVFCANCHGIKGDGLGNLHTSGKYIIPPTSLITPAVMSYKPGEIYHVITTGWGVMGAHGSLIRPDDRWKIIAFIENMIQEK